MSRITDLVSDLVSPVIEKAGVSLWDVEFERVGGEQYLRIYIDSENSIYIDQCEEVSKAIDPLLDEADLIDGPYILEVSSPGIERALKKPEHFRRYVGSLIEVKLYKVVEGSKRFSGTLQSYTDNHIAIDVSGALVTIPLDNIAKANLKYEWQ